ncbi:MAG TPA: tyrosine-protein phosphatase [Acidimicrobiales bacterium]|nr:tyrosine-protein phosphatase [Acidimicrobiales bacterium]
MERQRTIPFEGASNFRDLGGYPNARGRRTRWGAVYRSGALHKLTAADSVVFQRLGVQAVFDLRGNTERAQQPDPMPSVHLPVQDELPEHEMAQLLRAQSASEAEEIMFGIYLDLLEERAPVFGRLLTELADRAKLPALFHCAAGKDRAGLASALLLSALEVDRESVLADYELTGELIREEFAPVRTALTTAGASAGAIDVMLGSPRAPLAGALEEIDRRYGGAKEYLHGPAGLEPSTSSRLQEVLTEPFE